MNEDAFQSAFAKTMLHEGEYSFDPHDSGKETFMGISRVYWPDWEGWEIIDKALLVGRKLSECPELPVIVKRFYRQQFWNRFNGDRVAGISPDVAIETFDTAVNLGVYKAVTYLQEALNLLNRNERNYPDMVVDGLVGPATLRHLDLHMSQWPRKDSKETLLLNVMNTLQGMHYVKKMRENPEKERFRGWFLRV